MELASYQRSFPMRVIQTTILYEEVPICGPSLYFIVVWLKSHATELIKAGWDASYVQKRLGHAQVQTTINTYVHLDDEALIQKWRAYQEEKKRGKPNPPHKDTQ